MNKKIKKNIAYLSSLFFILLLWIILSKVIKSSLILPGPILVFKSIIKLSLKKSFWLNFLYTFVRVLVSFLISVILGTLIGFLAGVNDFIKDFVKLPLSIIRVTPVLSIILITLFWFKSSTVPVFVSVLMTLPIMITSVTSGFSSCDENLLQMSKVFNFSKIQILKYIKIPNAVPYFFTGSLSVFGLTWKVVIAGEIISLPKRALGTIMQQDNYHLETSNVIAETLILILISFILERIFEVVINKIILKRK